MGNDAGICLLRTEQWANRLCPEIWCFPPAARLRCAHHSLQAGCKYFSTTRSTVLACSSCDTCMRCYRRRCGFLKPQRTWTGIRVCDAAGDPQPWGTKNTVCRGIYRQLLTATYGHSQAHKIVYIYSNIYTQNTFNKSWLCRNKGQLE